MGEVEKVKRAKIGFIVSLIGGIFILLAGLWLFGMVSALSGFAGVTFSGLLGAIGVMYGVLGIVFGLIVILGAVLIYMPGKEIIGGVVVLIFSLVSIVAGGGFFIGLILGIIGGILGMLKK